MPIPRFSGTYFRSSPWHGSYTNLLSFASSIRKERTCFLIWLTRGRIVTSVCSWSRRNSFQSTGPPAYKYGHSKKNVELPGIRFLRATPCWIYCLANITMAGEQTVFFSNVSARSCVAMYQYSCNCLLCSDRFRHWWSSGRGVWIVECPLVKLCSWWGRSFVGWWFQCL
jgi:hypothetical protein